MVIDTERLCKVANYAKFKNVTPTCVYKWMVSGECRVLDVDGVKFVLMEIEESKKYKKWKLY